MPQVWFESHLGDLAETIKHAITQTGLDPKDLVLFIPETALADKPEEVLQTILELHNAGVQLMLDKFGAGYTALRWLDQLPLLGMRLDPSLIGSMEEPGASPQLMKSLLSIAHSLGFLVVATQIDNKSQLETLRQIGCDAYQGNMIEPCLYEDDFQTMIREGRHESR